MSDGPKILNLNKPQKRFFYSLVSGLITFATSIWGRSTGKSYVIALLIHYIVQNMPRATWGIQGATFVQLLTRTLPETFDALEQLGYYRDVHYVINKEPSKSWGELPFKAPISWQNYITFYNKDGCVGFKLLSQDREGSSRGPRLEGIICDESLTIDPVQFQKETKATNTGNLFKWKTPIHHGIFHFTSMPHGKDGEWLLDHNKYYEEQNYYFRKLVNDRIKLQLEFLKQKDVKYKLEVWKQLQEYDNPTNKDKFIRFFAHKRHLYSEANVFDNITNVGLATIQSEYETAPDKLMFAVEYLNYRMSGIQNHFYPGLDRNIHGYKNSYNYQFIDSLGHDYEAAKQADCRRDNDVNKDLPLELGMDFGTMNWCIVAQQHKLQNKLNVVKNFYVQLPKLITDLAQQFCDYYKYHGKKVANLHPDNNGFKKDGQKPRTSVQLFTDVLQSNGWVVNVKRRVEQNPFHDDKHRLWGFILQATRKHEAGKYPFIYFNINNCNELLFAMEHTPAMDKGDRVAKDKSSENTQDPVKQVTATHSTDAVDYIVWDLYRQLLPTQRSSASTFI